MKQITASSPIRIELPSTAGVCAFDADECTATVAFDSEEEMQAFIAPLPGRKRARITHDESGADAARQAWLVDKLAHAVQILIGQNDGRDVIDGDALQRQKHAWRGLGYTSGSKPDFLARIAGMLSILGRAIPLPPGFTQPVELGTLPAAWDEVLRVEDLTGAVEANPSGGEASIVLRDIEDGRVFASFPTNTPPAAVVMALRLYEKGVVSGKRDGLNEIQIQLARMFDLPTRYQVDQLRERLDRLEGGQ